MENNLNGQNQANQDGEWHSAGSTDNSAAWGQSSAQAGSSSQNMASSANTYPNQGGLAEKPVNIVTGIVICWCAYWCCTVDCYIPVRHYRWHCRFCNDDLRF